MQGLDLFPASQEHPSISNINIIFLQDNKVVDKDIQREGKCLIPLVAFAPQPLEHPKR